MARRTSFWFYVPPPLIAGALIAFLQYRKHQDPPQPLPDDVPPAIEEAQQGQDQPSPSPDHAPTATPAAKPAPTETVETAPEPPVTDLDEATALFPGLAAKVFPPERIADWLAQSDLLRRIVGIVDCLANGVSPKGQMEFLAPRTQFQAVRGAGGLQAAPANSLRTKVMVDTFCLANTQAMAAAYNRLEPVFDRLYQDQGYPDARFRSALGRACKVLLSTPVPDQEPTLVRSGTAYFYADQGLEQLPVAQKHLLRLGVRDAKRVQAKIRQLAGALQLDIQ